MKPKFQVDYKFDANVKFPNEEMESYSVRDTNEVNF